MIIRNSKNNQDEDANVSVFDRLIRVNRGTDDAWSHDEFEEISDSLQRAGKEVIITRSKYVLFKEIIDPKNTEVSNLSKVEKTEDIDKSWPEGGGFNSGYGDTISTNESSKRGAKGVKEFLQPLDIQKRGSIADSIPSFKSIQSQSLRLNIGFDTEFQARTIPEGDSDRQERNVLNFAMSINIGDKLIRYFFLINPDYSSVTADSGGEVPLKLCLTDIFDDLRNTYLPDLPVVNRSSLVYKKKKWKDHEPFKVVDYSAMRDSVIPVTLVCHTGKADISVFRRLKYDVDLIRKVGEIQGGWMSTGFVRFRCETDQTYNRYSLVDLQIRDTMGLTPAEHKSLEALGEVVHRPKIKLPDGYIEHMAAYAVSDPLGFYEYAMNDADIVVDFCSELFQRNHAIPMTLSSAAASAMYKSIRQYLGVCNRKDYDRVYRGLEQVDEGLIQSVDRIGFLKATRYVPIIDNPDAMLINEFFERAYVGGFNTSYYIGWITEKTNDFDLKNAYPTAMAGILDIDFSKPVKDFPRGHVLSLSDVPDPLTPIVVVGNFDFPEDCYCPNIPVPAKGGLNVYPLHGRNVYMTGPDIYLALQLGARVTVDRGFSCQVLKTKSGEPSRCLAHAVTALVQDRAAVKKMGPEFSLFEKTLKVMVNSCYGKTAQNVLPKTRYNARKLGREIAEPSVVTSPYHASYITALVRCMLIASINQLHGMGRTVYSVTTDGFITDATMDDINSIDAYGFSDVFQEGRYILNQNRDPDSDDNRVWEVKHTNEILFNITTRGNVAVNDGGVLAHNSYVTGEAKGSMADREAYIIAVLSRAGKLKCPTKVWTIFSELVERKYDHQVTEIIRELSMDFDYKRMPLLATAKDSPVHYETSDGNQVIDTVIAEFDTRPFKDVAEFLSYRPAKQTEDCVKVKADLERVAVKASLSFKGYIGKDFHRKQLLSIISGYLCNKYNIPALDGLTQSKAVEVVNSWKLTDSPIKISDWKNAHRRYSTSLPYEYIEEMLEKIYQISSSESD